jgi:hypothetical protein
LRDKAELERERERNHGRHGEGRTDQRHAPGIDPALARLVQLQRMAGNRAVEFALRGRGPLAVQRDGAGTSVVPIQVVEIPKSDLSYEELIEDNINVVDTMLDHYDRALGQFETAMRSASAKEAEKKGVGEILLTEVTKMVAEKITDLALEEFPGAKTVYSSVKTLLDAIDKEEKRAAAAGYSHDLGVFVTTIRTQIGKLRDAFKDGIVTIKHDAHKAQIARTAGAQSAARTEVRLLNQSLRAQAAGAFSEAGLYQVMAEKWISGSVSGEGKAKGWVYIRLDKGWNVSSAYIHAPGGARLAEQMLREESGSVNLNDFKVRRQVDFMPQDLTSVSMWLDEKGHGSVIEQNLLAADNPAYYSTFVNKIRTVGIPPTTKLTGDEAEGGGD